MSGHFMIRIKNTPNHGKIKMSHVSKGITKIKILPTLEPACWWAGSCRWVNNHQQNLVREDRSHGEGHFPVNILSH